MIALDDYARLKREVDELDKEINQAKGARKELLGTARKKFGPGCKTVKDVDRIVEERRAARSAASTKYLAKYKEFMRLWRKAIKRTRRSRVKN